LTLVYQIDHGCKRLLHVARDRTVGSFNAFFDMLGEERSKAIVFVASDMWQAFRNVVRKRCSTAIHVLDRFHIAKLLNEAVDMVRRQEVRSLRAAGHPRDAHQDAVAAAQASREHVHRRARPPARAAADQSPLGSCMPAQGTVPALLELLLRPVGRELSGTMDDHGDALAHGAVQEVRPHAAQASARTPRQRWASEPASASAT
jgi:hypothetical protein